VFKASSPTQSMTQKKIYIIAGEASGDSHGAHLVQEIYKLDHSVKFYGLGGSKMKEAGVDVSHDLTRISALGLTDVLINYFKYRKIFYAALKEAERLQPDLIILIDSPAFNLRFSKKINRKFPVLYYISPQIWAWGGRRIHTIKKFISKLLVFFPFEKALYDRAGVPCTFVGHPLTDEIKQPPQKLSTSSKLLIGLMPGSRIKEVKRILPVLLESAAHISRKYPEISFILSESSNIQESIYDQYLSHYQHLSNLKVQRGRPYEVIKTSDFLIVTSGTATLETALHEKPLILVYKTAWLTYFLGRILIKINFLGIANVLAGKGVSPELIQADFTVNNVCREAEKLIQSEVLRMDQIVEFKKIREILAVGNSASLAAREALQTLTNYATATASSKKI